MNRLLFAFLFLAVCALSLFPVGCSSDDEVFNPGIIGSGTIVSETRTVDPFHSLELDAVAEVRIT